MSESSEKPHTDISKSHQGRKLFGIPLGKVSTTYDMVDKSGVDLSRLPSSLSGEHFKPIVLEGKYTEDRKGRRHWINIVNPKDKK